MFFQHHLALFPKFKIVCETEEHFGFINLRPKETYQNSAGYAEIDKELFQLTGNRIRYIETTDTNGSGRYVYNRPANLALDRENSRKTRISLATNHSKKLFSSSPADSLGRLRLVKLKGCWANLPKSSLPTSEAKL